MLANLNLRNITRVSLVTMVVFVGLGLTGLYFFGANYLSPIVQRQYQDKNCSLTVSGAQVYSVVYAGEDNSKLSALAAECNMYIDAQALYDSEAWQDAYQGFNKYGETYRTGILVLEAHEQAANSLLKLAKQEFTDEKFQVAVEHLSLLLEAYGDTKVLIQAHDLYLEVYVAWAQAELTQENFAEAEQVLINLQTWTDAQAKDDFSKAANYEFSNLYLTWAKFYEAGDDFENAVEKYQQAIAIDELSEIGIQAKNDFVTLLINHGEGFIAEQKFEEAIKVYQLGLSEYQSESQDMLRKTITGTYSAWALALAEQEDFNGALIKLEDASRLLQTEEAKLALEPTRNEIYQIFSNSSGEQAKILMAEFTRLTCEGKNPTLSPVLGIDEDKPLFAMFGIEETLPEEMLAQTPGQLRYVVCVEQENKMIESFLVEMRPYGMSPENYHYRNFTRIQYVWNLIITDARSGLVLNKTIIEGSTPPELYKTIKEQGYLLYYFGTNILATRLKEEALSPIPTSTTGNQPDINDLIKWLKENILNK